VTHRPAIASTASLLAIVVAILAIAACGTDVEPTDARTDAYEPVVMELVALLDSRPDLRDALTGAIDVAAVQDIDSLDVFYGYVDDLVTWIPVEREIVPRALRLHYVVNQASGDVLNTDPAFSDWLGRVAAAWGAFLDTPASRDGIESFASLPDYRVGDYVVGPSGWQTFNQFFARQIRPGKRPVEAPGDDTVVVSPADAIFMGAWPIDEQASITVKGVDWRIADLLDGSPHAGAFSNGTYTHSFLRPADYHRFHVPVGGVIREVRNVHGRVYLDVARNADGTLSSVNGDTYQFNQERGLVIIDSPTVGLVAVVPVGMTFISSVVLEPEVGATLRKGDELGYFQFGGSDIVLLFQENVVLEAEPGTKYLQGQRIGRAD